MGPWYGRNAGYGPANHLSGYIGPDGGFRGSTDGNIGNQSTGFGHFIGKIVDKGPENAADYSDSRYWVKELVEASPASPSPLPTDRPKFEALELKLAENPVFGDFKAKHVTATNLGEYSGADSGSDSHDLDTDGSVVVECHLIRGRGGVERWVFAHGGGGGGGSIYVVVREVFAAPSKTIKVQKVAYDFGDEEDGENAEITIKTVGDPFNVMAKPGLLSRDYQLWQWQTEIHQTRTRYLRADRVGGTWILSREHDVMTDRLPSGVRWTDCKPAATTR